MEKHNMQYGTIRIGQIVKLMKDAIGQEALLESCGENNYESTRKMLTRLSNEKDIRIDNLNAFQKMIENFSSWGFQKGFINKIHRFILPTVYYDLTALITHTNPYNTPTQKEVELQIMYTIALTLREIADEAQKLHPEYRFYGMEFALTTINYWEVYHYEKHIKLIPAAFEYIFSELKTPKTKLFEYWDNLSKSPRTNFSKSVNDWINKGKLPSWNIIKTIFVSESPANMNHSCYFLFKTRLFLAYFMENFLSSLEEQELVSMNFRSIVEAGLYSFCHYTFIEKSFKQLTLQVCQNPMFSILRFLLNPVNNGYISEYIREAFSKEGDETGSLYYIPLEKIHYPIFDEQQLNYDLTAFREIMFIEKRLSIFPEYGDFQNKTIQEKDIEVISKKNIGSCADFFYNWLKGRYFVLNHEFETGLNYYKTAFDEGRYFGGKYLSQYLEEFIAIIQKQNCKKKEFNQIHDWAVAMRFCLNKIDDDNGLNRNLRNDFDSIFPSECFIK